MDDLLARVQGLSFDLRPAVLDKLGLLPALLTLFERYTPQTGVQVDFKHRGMAGRFAPEVETAGYRILQEALTNAARHAGVSEVAVRVWTDADPLNPEMNMLNLRGGLNLRIEDRGCGFDPEVARRAQRRSGLEGMRERTEILGGRMTVQSSPGAGTTILADDHPIVRTGIKTLLEREPDFSIAGVAADGHETIRLTQQLKPNVLLLDLMMPEPGGLEVLRILRQSSPTTSIVILTLHSSTAFVARALQSGASGYVLKSGPEQDVVRAVRRPQWAGAS